MVLFCCSTWRTPRSFCTWCIPSFPVSPLELVPGTRKPVAVVLNKEDAGLQMRPEEVAYDLGLSKRRDAKVWHEGGKWRHSPTAPCNTGRLWCDATSQALESNTAPTTCVRQRWHGKFEPSGSLFGRRDTSCWEASFEWTDFFRTNRNDLIWLSAPLVSPRYPPLR